MEWGKHISEHKGHIQEKETNSTANKEINMTITMLEQRKRNYPIYRKKGQKYHVIKMDNNPDMDWFFLRKK